MVRDREFCDWINHYVNYSGFTGLHYAVVIDDETLIKYLLEHGADPTLENNRGYTPANYCVNERVKVMLEEYTVKVGYMCTCMYFMYTSYYTDYIVHACSCSMSIL